jgi:hypothetical protein
MDFIKYTSLNNPVIVRFPNIEYLENAESALCSSAKEGTIYLVLPVEYAKGKEVENGTVLDAVTVKDGKLELCNSKDYLKLVTKSQLAQVLASGCSERKRIACHKNCLKAGLANRKFRKTA